MFQHTAAKGGSRPFFRLSRNHSRREPWMRGHGEPPLPAFAVVERQVVHLHPPKRSVRVLSMRPPNCIACSTASRLCVRRYASCRRGAANGVRTADVPRSRRTALPPSGSGRSPVRPLHRLPRSTISCKVANCSAGACARTIFYNLRDGPPADTTWHSSNTAVVTVSTTGLLTVVGFGEAQVTASATACRHTAARLHPRPHRQRGFLTTSHF